MTTGIPLAFIKYAFKGTSLYENKYGIVLKLFLRQPVAMGSIRCSESFVPPALVHAWSEHSFSSPTDELTGPADFSVARLVPQRRTLALVLLGTSHVMFTFQARPFTNSIEALLVALALIILQVMHRKHSVASPVAMFSSLAVVCVIGVFTRITFAAFALPIALKAFRIILKPQGQSDTSLSSRLRRILPAVIFGALATLLFVGVDSLYFKVILARPTLTPLNFLLYNLSPENLAQHGLHPRWLHVFVNLPMIVGPPLLLMGMQAAWSYIRADKSMKGKSEENTSSVITSSELGWGRLVVIC